MKIRFSIIKDADRWFRAVSNISRSKPKVKHLVCKKDIAVEQFFLLSPQKQQDFGRNVPLLFLRYGILCPAFQENAETPNIIILSEISNT